MMWTLQLFVMMLFVWLSNSLIARIRNTGVRGPPGLVHHPYGNQGYRRSGPGYAAQAPSGRQLVPVVHSSPLRGLTSFVMDGDVLQEKACGSSVHSPQFQNIGVQISVEPAYKCSCKAFSDSFDVRRIDNSFMARMDCMTEISHYYCCLNT